MPLCSSAGNRYDTPEPSKPRLTRQCATPRRFGDAATAAVETPNAKAYLRVSQLLGLPGGSTIC